MTTADSWPRRWPLAALAVPAGVATWSGWVGLGGLTGFGKVRPLPGIADGFTINSAITLPIGVEAYAAYALSAWLTTAPTSEGTRRFARNSAIGALVLGMLGQVAYHLLTSEKRAAAPWEITTAVSCLPVLVLGAGAALAHMLHRDRMAVPDTEDETAPVPEVEVHREPSAPVPAPVSAPAPAPVPMLPSAPAPVPETAPKPSAPVRKASAPAPIGVHLERARDVFGDELAAGQIPSIRRLKTVLGVGQPRAKQVHEHLSESVVQ